MRLRKFLRSLCFLFCFSLCVVFFLEEFRTGDSFSRDTLIVVDVGFSMNVQDSVVSDGSGGTHVVSRLESVKSFLASGFSSSFFSSSKTQVGLVIFSQYPWFVVPFTHDMSGFQALLAGLTSVQLGDVSSSASGLFSFLSPWCVPGKRIFVFSDFNAFSGRDFGGEASNISSCELVFVGMGSAGGDVVRYAHGGLVRIGGKKVFSSRRDDVGKALAKRWSGVYVHLEHLVLGVDEMSHVRSFWGGWGVTGGIASLLLLLLFFI